MQKVDRNKELRQKALKALPSISKDDKSPIRNLVFATTIEKANEYLNGMISEFKYKEIKIIQRNENEFKVEMVNGDTYRVVPATDGCNGHRCDRVFVDSAISLDFLNQTIKPHLCSSRLPKEEQIVYFD